jgi:hypothetical protein
MYKKKIGKPLTSKSKSVNKASTKSLESDSENAKRRERGAYTPPELTREVQRSAKKTFRLGCVLVSPKLQSRITEILKGHYFFRLYFNADI